MTSSCGSGGGDSIDVGGDEEGSVSDGSVRGFCISSSGSGCSNCSYISGSGDCFGCGYDGGDDGGCSDDSCSGSCGNNGSICSRCSGVIGGGDGGGVAVAIEAVTVTSLPMVNRSATLLGLLYHPNIHSNHLTSSVSIAPMSLIVPIPHILCQYGTGWCFVLQSLVECH